RRVPRWISTPSWAFWPGRWLTGRRWVARGTTGCTSKLPASTGCDGSSTRCATAGGTRRHWSRANTTSTSCATTLEEAGLRRAVRGPLPRDQRSSVHLAVAARSPAGSAGDAARTVAPCAGHPLRAVLSDESPTDRILCLRRSGPARRGGHRAGLPPLACSPGRGARHPPLQRPHPVHAALRAAASPVRVRPQRLQCLSPGGHQGGPTLSRIPP